MAELRVETLSGDNYLSGAGINLVPPTNSSGLPKEYLSWDLPLDEFLSYNPLDTQIPFPYNDLAAIQAEPGYHHNPGHEDFAMFNPGRLGGMNFPIHTPGRNADIQPFDNDQARDNVQPATPPSDTQQPKVPALADLYLCHECFAILQRFLKHDFSMQISLSTCDIHHNKPEMALHDAVTMSGALPLSSQTSSTESAIATPSHGHHQHRVAKQPRASSSQPRVGSYTPFYCRFPGCRRRYGGDGKGFLRKDNRNTHEKIHERTMTSGSQEDQPASALPQLGMTSGLIVRLSRQVYPRINGEAYCALLEDQEIAERFEMSGALD